MILGGGWAFHGMTWGLFGFLDPGGARGHRAGAPARGAYYFYPDAKTIKEKKREVTPVKPPGDLRFWSLVPFARVPFWEPNSAGLLKRSPFCPIETCCFFRPNKGTPPFTRQCSGV